MSTTDKLLRAMGVSLAFSLWLVFLLPISTLIGAVAGWATGLFFGDTILPVFEQIGIRGVTMWQLGAFLMFVGCFLRTKTTVEQKDAAK